MIRAAVGERKMAKKRKLPLLATAGALVFAANAYTGYTKGNAAGAGWPGFRWATIGVANDGKFYMDQFIKNILPPAVGAAGSMIAAKTGVNRYIQSVPFVKF